MAPHVTSVHAPVVQRASSRSPSSSSPTQPTIVTGAPRRAAVTAWFSPCRRGRGWRAHPRTVRPVGKALDPHAEVVVQTSEDHDAPRLESPSPSARRMFLAFGAMEHRVVAEAVERGWAEAVLPSLTEYVRIPAVSPIFDPGWEATGEQIDQAVEHARAWAAHRPIEGLEAEIVRLPERRTPLLLIDIPAFGNGAADAGSRAAVRPRRQAAAVHGLTARGFGPWDPGRGGRAGCSAAAPVTTATPSTPR